MPVTEKIIINDGIIGLFKMTEKTEDLENSYFECFREAPVNFDFQHNRRKKEWLTVRLLIADLIGTDFSIEYAKDGSPRINHSDFFYISISHSIRYATVYLHKNKKVGIDIESLDRKFSYIEKKYLSDVEQEQVRDNQNLKAIYWSCKEAIFKWAGNEGVDFRKQIKIEEFDHKETNTINAIFEDKETYPVRLNFQIFDEHSLAYTL